MAFRRPSVIICYWIVCTLSVGAITVVEAFTGRSRMTRLRQRATVNPSSCYLAPRRIKSTTSLQLSNRDEDEPRDNGRAVRGIQSALKTIIEVGDTVVCKRSLPNLGIYENSSYEVRSLYEQYFDEDTQQIVKQPLSSLGDDITTKNTVYMTLFSPQHHSEAVIVSPEEVGLVSVRTEFANAAWLAVPGFFWVFLAASFYNTYHERTGGSLSDAFLGR